ncbi:hypothetical protein N0O92_08965 [Alkalihalobacillus sp. MEB130]|uniref:hypothetical protein n=1 Tax=Alkalihalobacillus sp. MEB130 TaxID=2976704 RepID=UPI0028DE6A0A|nr:hypothetical protein [Alkalihalobacillus sp. MEB130]MDT8860363.1 hypothetical protein [Alkalihalobacillus sp. MEB130]
MKSLLYPSMNFQKPMNADVSIAEFNGQVIKSSKKKVSVYDLSSEGLSFSTNLDFPLLKEVPLVLKVELFSQCTFTGEVAMKEEKEDGLFYYRLNVTTCSLLFYKMFEHMRNTHHVKMPVPYINASATG